MFQIVRKEEAFPFPRQWTRSKSILLFSESSFLQPRQKKWTQDFSKLNCCLKNANNYLNLSHNILYDIQVDVPQLASSGAPIVRGYPSMVE